MRLLHGADFHIGLNRYSPAAEPLMRLDDQLATLRRFFEAAKDADAAVIAGDLSHYRNPTPTVVAEITKIVGEHSRSGGCPLIILPGNHDGMSTVGDPRSHTLGWLAEAHFDNVWVVTSPTLVTLPTSPLSQFLCYPYPHRRAFDQIAPEMSPEERMIEIGRFVEQEIAAHDSWAATDGPRVFVGHLSVAGSRVASERTMKFGWDVMVGAEAFEGYDYAALGHIHVAQNIGPKAYYPGSPEYIDFGEAGLEKGFLLAEVERGKSPLVTRIDSHPRPMVVLDHPEGTEAHVPEGAIVRALLAPDQKLVVDGAVFVERRYDPPERTVAATRDALAVDLDWESALRHWLKQNDQPEEPALSAARSLIEAP